MLRVLALVPYPLRRVPGQRYRIEQWAAQLGSEGIEVVFSPFLDERTMGVLYEPGHQARKAWGAVAGYVRRWRESNSLGGFDVVYIYREAALLGTSWLEARLSRARPLVYDFDDAIYLPATSAANAGLSFLKRPGKVTAICRLSRHVVVGNETLAVFARQHSSSVTVVPSTIDTDAYRPAPRLPNPRPVVGWTGSATTLPYLEGLQSALLRLRERIDYELRVIGPRTSLSRLDVRCLPWRAETEVDDLRPLDVGIMPLPDDEWSRGKCGMKALQYMGLAIPAVVSPVGANTTIVQDGVSGFHARTEDEWVDRLALLLSDPDLRVRLGTAGRRTVEETYSAAVQAPRMAAVLRAAATG